MMIRLSDGFIGFEGLDINNQCAPVSQFWEPSLTDLQEFREDALFWSQVVATPHANGVSYQRVSGSGTLYRNPANATKEWAR